MKFLSKFRLVFIISLIVAFVPTARANLINITNDLGSPASSVNDYAAHAIGGLGDQNVANWLGNEITSYNAYLNPGTDLAPPVGFGMSFSGTSAISLTGYTYAVVHYGSGPGGSPGGGVMALFLNGTTGLFQFDQNGAGPNGFGGISFVRLYGPGGDVQVPDVGSTIAFLGLALVGMGMARRKFFN